jgi:DHA1 family bicyclomycin/chloramphenicol resistance-like MFS transporter/DHA1 family 2-module integral membrane pump EmrD-like MFS transporter
MMQMFSTILYLLFYYLEVNNIIVVIAPMVFFVLGTGMINPNSTAVLVSSFPNYAATAAAAMGTVMTFGTFFVSSVIFLFNNNTILSLGLSLLLFALLIRCLIVLKRTEIITIS